MMASESIGARTRVREAAVDQARTVSELQNSRLAALQVRAGFAGVLQQVPVDVGQQVTPGQNLARVADPGRLKAELLGLLFLGVQLVDVVFFPLVFDRVGAEFLDGTD